MSAEPRPNVVIPELLQGQWTVSLICTFGANLTFFETRLMSLLTTAHQLGMARPGPFR